ncbi:MAG: TonB-dependent receptor [Proteobacteria bacterium]|nr:TonB-dependent receptor [Pseudomonadota bacterium]
MIQSQTFLLFALPALAMAEPAASVDQSATLGEIVVTGSHIRTIDVETQHPIVVIDHAEIERSGLSNVAEIAQLVVANGETLNRNINNGGNGEQLVDLRSLGANRTLVLLNGQRFVSDIDGAVDLSAIPLALVDRIEVLLDGASAIYGSDAIAGVVNIITRRNYEGSELDAYFGQNDHDDGERRAYDLTVGRTGNGWSASGGVEWSRDNPIFAGNRAISAVPLFGLPPGASGSTATPYSWLTLDSGERVRLIDGRPGISPDDFRPVDGAADRYNFAASNYLQTPQETRSAFAQLRYEFTPTLAVNFDALYHQRRSSQQLAPSVLRLIAPDVPYPDAIAISADNIYNPFGEPVDITARRLVEAGPRVQHQTDDTRRLHASLDGLVTAFGRDFAWGADIVATRTRTRDDDGPYGDNRKLAPAVGPSFRDANGTPRCGTPSAPIPDCVPLDLFGPPGSITPAMLAYATAFETGRAEGDSHLASLHASAERVVDLPAGPVALAAGLEHRRESGADLPDALRASGNENGNGGTYEATRGAYSVSEAYLELNVPLLADRAFAHRLDLVVGTRYSHYSNFGNTTNSQLGLNWRPTGNLLVRANYAQGFRAPAVSELFAGTSHFHDPLLADPCDAYFGPPPEVLSRCAALGVPATLDSSTQLAGVTAKGNPGLRPEISRSRGAGFVYAPSWLDGLDLGIDWYDIRLRKAIGDNGDQAIVDGCYYYHNDSDCALITRNPGDGTISNVTDMPENTPGGLQASGYDLALHYRHDTAIGRVRVAWNANYVDYIGELDHPRPGSPLADGSVAYGNVAGLSVGGLYQATWRWRSRLQLTWERAPWSASLTLRSFSDLTENCRAVTLIAGRVGDPALADRCSNPDPNLLLGDALVASNHVGSVTFTDLEAAWETPWRGRVRVGLRNALDRDPPVAYSAFTNSFFPDYDVPGRFYYASYRQMF